jgi:F-type H+-transporting ATPase subunit c
MNLTKINKVISNMFILVFLSVPVMANDSAVSVGFSESYGLIAISGALCISFTASMGAMSQGTVASAALSGMARNPEASGKIFVPMILAMALIESLVLFSLLISLTLVGKIV